MESSEMTTQLGSAHTVQPPFGLPYRAYATADRYSVHRPARASKIERVEDAAIGLSTTLDRAGAMIGRWIAGVREEFRVRRVIAELEALDDHMLKDIGLTRCGISYVARAKIDARWP